MHKLYVGADKEFSTAVKLNIVVVNPQCGIVLVLLLFTQRKNVLPNIAVILHRSDQ